jgi:hypothetical protein
MEIEEANKQNEDKLDEYIKNSLFPVTLEKRHREMTEKQVQTEGALSGNSGSL